MLLTRIFWPALSSAIALASWISAPLAAQYHGRPARATRPSCEAIKMMLPPARASMAGMACLQNRKAPSRLTAMVRRQSASVRRVSGASGRAPTPVDTTTSRPPDPARAARTAPPVRPQHVETAELAARASDCRLGACLLGDVGDQRLHATAGGAH